MIDPDSLGTYGPFDRDSLLPAVEGAEASDGAAATDDDRRQCPPHPAMRAMRELQRSILILTSLSPRTAMAEGCNARVQLSQLFQSWIQSLQGEIAEGWACHDRAELWSNPAVVFDESPADSSRLEADHGRDKLATASAVDNADKTSVTVRQPFTGGARSQNRLSFLLERYWMARMVVETLLGQGRDDAAFSLVLNYISSSIPTDEDSPAVPPVLSFVVLRGMLKPTATPRDAIVGESKSWFADCLLTLEHENRLGATLLHVLSLALRRTADLWQSRVQSTDDRISDVAQVEIASYEDLMGLIVDSLVGTAAEAEKKTATFILSDVARSIRTIVHDATNQQCSPPTADSSTMQPDAWQIWLILNVEMQELGRMVRQSLRDAEGSDGSHGHAVVAAQALRQLILRQLDGLCERVGRLTGDVVPSLPWSLEYQPRPTDSMETLVEVLDCAELLGDGQTAIQVIDQILAVQRTGAIDPLACRRLFDSVQRACTTPMVRVINLQRRLDRWNAFCAQCLRENLLVVRGVADLVDAPETDCHCLGAHALDGSGRKAAVHDRLAQMIGGASKLKLLVNAEWCPNDLKPFDKDAPNDEGMVRMTDSEVACALSHIASWKGALRTLELSVGTATAVNSETALFCHPQYTRRLLHLAGFAEGLPLLSRHATMAPAAVCCIVEDDAMLVDRFRDRLSEVLQELPRDFHFCALGYGRPKSAPVAPFSRHVGVPSHQFYLTGYLVSALGCRHLLQSLPVVGPVDAWIALQQTRNWDNSYGATLGVGSHARPGGHVVGGGDISAVTAAAAAAIAPSRSDLARILQFRAFCAVRPLCYQKVGAAAGWGGDGDRTNGGTVAGSAAAAASGGARHERRNWRLRDTDIVYSGGQRRTGRDSRDDDVV